MKVTKGRILKRKFLNNALWQIEISLESPIGNFSPGNFVMLSLENHLSPFLPRPFSIFDLKGDRLKLIFKTVGKGTALLSSSPLPLDIMVWGPLGNHFPKCESKKNIVVAGGLGLVPLFNLNRIVKVHKFFVGYKCKEEAFLVKELEKKYDTTIATDDGSLGKKGFITEHFEAYLATLSGKEINVYACGPHPFLKRVWEIGKRYDIKNIFASFETVMACGFGVCLGCAIETPFGYVKICKKGPVFPINEIFG